MKDDSAYISPTKLPPPNNVGGPTHAINYSIVRKINITFNRRKYGYIRYITISTLMLSAQAKASDSAEIPSAKIA